MYIRQQGNGAGKILLQPVRTEKPDENAVKNDSVAVKNVINAENSEEKIEKTEAVDISDVEKTAGASTEKESENVAAGELENAKRRKSQYKARRPVHKENDTEVGELQAKELQANVLQEGKQPSIEAPNVQNVPNGALRVRFSDGAGLDEMLVLAVLVLLVMQGSDDILVLALCYILL